MPKDFDFTNSLNMGEMGVTIVKSVLRNKYPNITDYNDDMEMQRRGVDLLVEGLGTVEVKTDSHSSDKFFFELSVAGKPGAVDRCSADYFMVLYFKERVIYIIKRAELQKWLREHWSFIRREHKDWVKTISSSNKGKRWSAVGITVPRETFTQDVNVAVLTWEESEESMGNVNWEKGEK